MCLILTLAGVSICANADDQVWKQYSDPDHRFNIQHPGTTEAEAVQDKDPGLLSRVRFKFEQSYRNGPDVGSLKFSFQISVWQNTNHLTAGAWAKRDAGPQLALNTQAMRIAGRNAVAVRASNQAWIIVKIFVDDEDCMYELRYMDISEHKILLPDDTRSHWVATFHRMEDSFKIISKAGRSK